MRKLVFFVLLILSLSAANGQNLYPPIQPYQENDYSIAQFKEFANSQTELSSNWKIAFVDIVNSGLANAGENMVLDQSNVYWILDHVTYERRKLTSFINSRNVNDKIDFFSDKNYDGMVGVFNWGRCSLVVFKTRCMNLLKVPVEIVQVAPKIKECKPEIIPEQTKQDNWTFQPPKKIYEKPAIDLNIYNPPVVKKGHKGTWVWYTIAGIALTSATAGVYYLTRGHHYYGGPGGAPTTKIEQIHSRPKPVVPGVPGGPGGAPTTPGY